MVPKIAKESTTTATAPAPGSDAFAVFASKDSTAIPPVANHSDDFIWSLKDEPHFSRRMTILKKYPAVRLFPRGYIN
jgi:hypothetical protein